MLYFSFSSSSMFWLSVEKYARISRIGSSPPFRARACFLSSKNGCNASSIRISSPKVHKDFENLACEPSQARFLVGFAKIQESLAEFRGAHAAK